VAVQPSGTGSGTGVAVSVTGARANVPVEVNTSGVATQAGEVAVDAVSLTPLTDGNFTLDVSASTTPDQVSQTFPADAADALGVVTVTHSIPDRDIGDVRFRLRVAKATLAARGLAAEEVVLYRFSGTWAALNTTVVAETDAAYVVEAVSPGLSTFVLAPARPVFVVQEPTGPGTTAVAGTTVTFGVTVENTGARPGQRVVDLVVDGVVDGSETVELAPGERRTVTLTHRFAAAGTYQVSLADQSLGTLSVSAEATEPSADQPPDESELSDPTPEPTTTDAPASGPSVSSQPALLGLVGLVALVLALLSIALARRR
jgi:PGF-pre-PGF domain-containing protein